jgi:hypothetical protein
MHNTLTPTFAFCHPKLPRIYPSHSLSGMSEFALLRTRRAGLPGLDLGRHVSRLRPSPDQHAKMKGKLRQAYENFPASLHSVNGIWVLWNNNTPLSSSIWRDMYPDLNYSNHPLSIKREWLWCSLKIHFIPSLDSGSDSRKKHPHPSLRFILCICVSQYNLKPQSPGTSKFVGPIKQMVLQPFRAARYP